MKPGFAFWLLTFQLLLTSQSDAALPVNFTPTDLLGQAQVMTASGATVGAWRDLRETLQRHLAPKSTAALDESWTAAARLSFTGSLRAEWPDAPAAVEGLHAWWRSLAAATVPDRTELADLALDWCGQTLRRDARLAPESAAVLLDEGEARLLPAVSPSARERWRWWSARFEETFYTNADRVPPERRAGFLARAEARLTRYWNDPSLPLPERTHALAIHARTLYAEGRPDPAAALLDGWRRQQSDAALSAEALSVRFFVAYLGQGDGDTARAMVARLDDLAARGLLPRDDPHYLLALQSYYKHLSLPEHARLALASRLMQERREKTFAHP